MKPESRASHAWRVMLLLLGACRREEALEPAIPVAPAASAAIAAAPARPAEAAPDTASAEPPRMRVADYEHSAYFQASNIVDLEAWKEANAVVARSPGGQCWDAGDRVGVPPAPGLFCEVTISEPPRTTSSLYRSVQGGLALVWTGRVAAWANWLELTPELTADGQTLTLHDRAPGACDRAICESQRKIESNKQMEGLHDELVAGCAEVGVYAWSTTRYVLKEPAIRDQEPCSDGRW